MNKKNIHITERANEVRQFLYSIYCSHMMSVFGFEHDESFRTTGSQIRWVHPQQGWALIIYSSYANMRIVSDEGTEILRDSYFISHLIQEGIFDWNNGYLDADYESPLEEIFQVLLHYLTDEEIIKVLRKATCVDRDWEDIAMRDAPDELPPC